MDGALEAVIRNVYIAEGGQDEGVVDADSVGQGAFCHRDNGSPDDGLHQQTRTFAVSGPSPSIPRAENAREHH